MSLSSLTMLNKLENIKMKTSTLLTLIQQVIMNSIVNYPTEREIPSIAYQALNDQLGSTGFICFIQQ